MCIPAVVFEYEDQEDWLKTQKEKKEELPIDRSWCAYSGLPGVEAYVKKDKE